MFTVVMVPHKRALSAHHTGPPPRPWPACLLSLASLPALQQESPLRLTGLAPAALAVGWPLEVDKHLEISLFFARGVPLGVAAAWLRAVAEGAW